MIRPTKEAIEYIDLICEQSIDHPVDTKSVGDEDRIAEIANEVFGFALDNTEIEHRLALVGTELLGQVNRLVRLTRVVTELNHDLEQRLNQLRNLEKRVFQLEQKRGKTYTRYADEQTTSDPIVVNTVKNQS